MTSNAKLYVVQETGPTWSGFEFAERSLELSAPMRDPPLETPALKT